MSHLSTSFQSGYISVFYSGGTDPLQLWSTIPGSGRICRITDNETYSELLELSSNKIDNTFIVCPPSPDKSLGIKASVIFMLVRSVKKLFSFEVQVQDDENIRRRFRASNFQNITRVQANICTMPLILENGWNLIMINLADFTRKAYGTNYVKTERIQVHANCLLKRIFFSDKVCTEEELPEELKLCLVRDAE